MIVVVVGVGVVLLAVLVLGVGTLLRWCQLGFFFFSSFWVNWDLALVVVLR